MKITKKFDNVGVDGLKSLLDLLNKGNVERFGITFEIKDQKMFEEFADTFERNLDEGTDKGTEITVNFDVDTDPDAVETIKVWVKNREED